MTPLQHARQEIYLLREQNKLGLEAIELLRGMIGLVEIIERRDDCSGEIRILLEMNHRIRDARALLARLP